MSGKHIDYVAQIRKEFTAADTYHRPLKRQRYPGCEMQQASPSVNSASSLVMLGWSFTLGIKASNAAIAGGNGHRSAHPISPARTIFDNASVSPFLTQPFSHGGQQATQQQGQPQYWAQ